MKEWPLLVDERPYRETLGAVPDGVLSNSNRRRSEKFLMRNRNLEGPFRGFGALSSVTPGVSRTRSASTPPLAAASLIPARRQP